MDVRLLDRYTYYRGALFRRLGDDVHEGVAYCPECLAEMISPLFVAPYRCTSCGVFAEFSEEDVPRIATELTHQLMFPGGDCRH